MMRYLFAGLILTLGCGEIGPTEFGATLAPPQANTQSRDEFLTTYAPVTDANGNVTVEGLEISVVATAGIASIEGITKRSDSAIYSYTAPPGTVAYFSTTVATSTDSCPSLEYTTIIPTFSVVPKETGVYYFCIRVDRSDPDSDFTQIEEPIYFLGPSITITNAIDTTKPVPTFVSDASSVTNSVSIGISVTFSEPIFVFTLSALVVSGGRVPGLTGSGSSYAFTLTPTAEGLVRVTMPATSVEDIVGNPMVESVQFDHTVDVTRPTVVMSSSAENPVTSSTIAVVADFSETIFSMSTDAVVCSNCFVSAVSGSDASYVLTIEPSAAGLFGVAIPAGVVRDEAGNANRASNTLTYTFSP